jgi:hypothetical protein
MPIPVRPLATGARVIRARRPVIVVIRLWFSRDDQSTNQTLTTPSGNRLGRKSYLGERERPKSDRTAERIVPSRLAAS